MDELGRNENYALKIILGTLIGLIIILFLVPLGANIIATEQVAGAANEALSNLDTSYEASSLNVPVDTSSFDVDDLSENEDDNTIRDDDDKSEVNVKDMVIRSGSISTGSGLKDKSVCKVYVGEEFAGQHIQISTLYSRDGTDLNEGRLVAKTVDSSGYVTLKAADSYDLYPDECLITIYDSSGDELDYRTVYLEIESGTQTF